MVGAGAGAGGGGGNRQPGSGRNVAPAAASTPVHSFLLTPDSPQPSHQVFHIVIVFCLCYQSIFYYYIPVTEVLIVISTVDYMHT